MKTIIFQISNKGVFYNPHSNIQWSKTNFPLKSEFNFREREEIYWKAKMLSFERKKSQLNVEVVDYNVVPNKNEFENQVAKFPIAKLCFTNLNWAELKLCMNIYRQSDFAGILKEDPKQKKIANREPKVFDVSIPQAITKRIDIDFAFPLIKVRFKMGHIEIQKKFKGIPKKVVIQLSNNNIIPEFDFVKPFFAKAIGKRKIRVVGFIEINENNEIKVDCSSAEINMINEKLIQAVKRLKLKDSIFKPEITLVDKIVFTPEEFFEGLGDDLLGNSIRQEDKDLINDILAMEGVRNRKQLLYLSGKLQNRKLGLRFTLSPNFGFLFFVKGKTMNHFIWELLNSHATYIWSLPNTSNSIDRDLEIVEHEINFIRDNGRRLYLGLERTKDIMFSKVNHENSQKGLVDGFPKWKNKVNEKLI